MCPRWCSLCPSAFIPSWQVLFSGSPDPSFTPDKAPCRECSQRCYFTGKKMPQLAALSEDGKMTVTWGTHGAVLSLPKKGTPPDSLRHLWIPEEGRGSEAFVTLLMLSVGRSLLKQTGIFLCPSPRQKVQRLDAHCRQWLHLVASRVHSTDGRKLSDATCLGGVVTTIVFNCITTIKMAQSDTVRSFYPDFLPKT